MNFDYKFLSFAIKEHKIHRHKHLRFLFSNKICNLRLSRRLRSSKLIWNSKAQEKPLPVPFHKPYQNTSPKYLKTISRKIFHQLHKNQTYWVQTSLELFRILSQGYIPPIRAPGNKLSFLFPLIVNHLYICYSQDANIGRGCHTLWETCPGPSDFLVQSL